MPSVIEGGARSPVERVHTFLMSLTAASLLAGLVARRADWVDLGLSLILLLPPLRLATTIAGEAHARRYRVAVLGTVVLALLLFSRRIS